MKGGRRGRLGVGRRLCWRSLTVLSVVLAQHQQHLVVCCQNNELSGRKEISLVPQGSGGLAEGSLVLNIPFSSSPLHLSLLPALHGAS